jgi:hypothetical protein
MQMNIFKTASTAVLLLSSLSAFATPITFVSGADDGCTSCTLSNQTAGSYVNPTGSVLDGASWIQASSSWNVNSTYSVWEMDLSNSGVNSMLTSLYVAFDDQIQIKINGTTIFDSLATPITHAWSQITNVFDYITPTYIGAGDTLDFYVSNTGLPGAVAGPTGIIWKGTATPETSVSEPSMFIALGLGLVALGFRRRKNSNL